MTQSAKKPLYTPEEGALLKQAGLSTRVKHPLGTIQALKEIPLAQLNRTRRVDIDERMLKDSERVITSRHVRVNPLSDALDGLNDEALDGLIYYHSLLEATVPISGQSYEPRQSGGEGDAGPDMQALDALSAMDRKIGRKVAAAARFAVRLERGAVIAVYQAENAERAGWAIYKAMD